jgi:hypothetical protein
MGENCCEPCQTTIFVRPLAFAVNVFYTDVLCDTAQGEFLLCGIAVYKNMGRTG